MCAAWINLFTLLFLLGCGAGCSRAPKEQFETIFRLKVEEGMDLRRFERVRIGMLDNVYFAEVGGCGFEEMVERYREVGEVDEADVGVARKSEPEWWRKSVKREKKFSRLRNPEEKWEIGIYRGVTDDVVMLERFSW